MNQYLIDTEYASKMLFDAVRQEEVSLDDLLKERESKRAQEEAFYIAFRARENQPTANWWFGEWASAAEGRREAEAAVAERELRIADRRFSVATLTGAILQVAKQGISIVWGRPENCPSTRDVAGMQIKFVIWEGRNQALHYEYPKHIDANCEGLFSKLNAAGANLGDPRGRSNLAPAVLKVLGWSDYESYLRDMEKLLAR